jgi:hypothetical protein
VLVRNINTLFDILPILAILAISASFLARTPIH